jgi:hypothetical protein
MLLKLCKMKYLLKVGDIININKDNETLKRILKLIKQLKIVLMNS